MQTVCTSLYTDIHTNASSLFLQADALPDAQPTVSKHSRVIVGGIKPKRDQLSDVYLALEDSVFSINGED